MKCEEIYYKCDKCGRKMVKTTLPDTRWDYASYRDGTSYVEIAKLNVNVWYSHHGEHLCKVCLLEYLEAMTEKIKKELDKASKL